MSIIVAFLNIKNFSSQNGKDYDEYYKNKGQISSKHLINIQITYIVLTIFYIYYDAY